ncbi:MAG: hypothetical protein HKO62_12785 [Gammaproteobacteria bacterium]|nr:hypothetical protein [Gammaproteobacteria bacterium]
MLLPELQSQLQSIYEVDPGHQVMDFLITDQQLAARLDDSMNARANREKLLLCESDDTIDIALYLDAGVLEHLEEYDPLTSLGSDNLHEFLLALEGVSHFLYLTFNAGFDKSVKLVELELQAEIDKYIVLTHLLLRQHEGAVPVDLHALLFDEPAFDARLSESERERYADANAYAARYCHGLNRTFGSDLYGRSLLTELRHFYRLPLNEKVSRIRMS